MQRVTLQRQWTRRLAWDDCANVRDLGGYPTADGQQTRWGAVVRSDSLAALTPAGRDALLAYGVRAVVDLRLPAEIAERPNPFAEPGDHGVAYTNVSILDPAAGFPPDTITLAENYLWSLDRFDALMAAAMAAIANAPEGGVLFHCAAGKDRTGLVAALLLALVGVPDQAIADDYALTAECLRSRNQAWLEHGPGERAEREALLARYAPKVEVMLEVLAGLRRRYGGVEAYLRAAGVADGDLAHLRARLLGPAGSAPPGC
jgi:protein-tyrosine phosphatase